jgi:hypothetical protein
MSAAGPGFGGARRSSLSRASRVDAVASDEYPLWLPESCLLCASGVPLEDVNAPAA